MIALIGSCNINDALENLFNVNKSVGDNWIGVKNNAKSLMDSAMINCIEGSTESTMAGRPKGVNKEFLSKTWMITEDLAQDSIDKNTQLVQHNQENSLSRNYSTNDHMLRYKQLMSVFYNDTLHATQHKSIRGNKYCQLFVSNKGYVAIYPMKL